LGRTAAVVCHGGSGSTLGVLAAGLIVVVPLFADQPHNAKRVATVGAGVVVAPEPHAIRDGLSRVLANESYRAAAESLAAEMRSNPAIDTAVEALAARARACLIDPARGEPSRRCGEHARSGRGPHRHDDAGDR
jgi:UDP:flavonoid glycosyltransferase YjiC (YdhE family)